MDYAICTVKYPNIAWWTGNGWSSSIEQAILFRSQSEAKKKIQSIYRQGTNEVASIVYINFETQKKTESESEREQLVFSKFGDRIKNLLLRAGLDSDNKIRKTPDYQLWKIRGLCEQSFYEIRSKLPYRN